MRHRTCFIGTRGTMLFKEYEKVPVLCKSMAWVQVPFSAGDTQQLQCLTVHPAWGLW